MSAIVLVVFITRKTSISFDASGRWSKKERGKNEKRPPLFGNIVSILLIVMWKTFALAHKKKKIDLDTANPQWTVTKWKSTINLLIRRTFMYQFHWKSLLQNEVVVRYNYWKYALKCCNQLIWKWPFREIQCQPQSKAVIQAMELFNAFSFCAR